MMGPAQLKSLGPYLARHLIWTAMTPPKDDPIGSHAHIVALELWSVCLRRLSRMGRWNLQMARLGVRGCSEELAMDLGSELDRPG